MASEGHGQRHLSGKQGNFEGLALASEGHGQRHLSGKQGNFEG